MLFYILTYLILNTISLCTNCNIFYKCENWGRENLVNLTVVSKLVVAGQALKYSNVNSDVWTMYYLLIITLF